MGLSNLGLFHTIIGIIAIFGGLIGFVKSGKIDLSKLSGKIYFYFTLTTSLTALGLSSVKGVNPGHILAFLIAILVGVSYFLHFKRPGNNKLRYMETFFLSFSFYLSMIPTVNETLNRIPIGNPIAHGPNDPIIANTLLFLFVILIVGSMLQYRKQKNINQGG